MSDSQQIAAFLAGSGISMSELKILFASILMSLVLILVMILMRGNHRSWAKEYIDFAEYASRTFGLMFILLIVTYLVN